MTTTELAPAQTQQIGLTLHEVKAYLAPLATDAEAYMFIRLCNHYDLNPWIRDAYLIKYKAGDPAAIVVGKDAILHRAQMSPDYRGQKAGVVTKRGTEVKEIEGAMIPEGATLIGGWCRLNPRERDPDPTIVRVSMAEYNKGQSSWRTMPATMIRKVAIVQAHREAYPGLVRGMYDAAEMPVIVEGDQVRTTTIPATSGITDTMCPLHDEPWRESSRGDGGLYHYISGAEKGTPSCNPSKAYKSRLAELWGQVAEPGTSANDTIKSRYSGRTWSSLTLNEILEVLAELEGRLPVTEADPETGEII
jgi:phage recombination protein Bet